MVINTLCEISALERALYDSSQLSYSSLAPAKLTRAQNALTPRLQLAHAPGAHTLRRIS